MDLVRRACAVALVSVVGVGCSHAPSPAGPGAPPGVGPSSVPPTPSTSGSPSATPRELDLTRPGAARTMVDRLVTASGGERVIMVTLTPRDASVTVLKDGSPQTWAWRDQRIQHVPSDITYVSQRAFDPSAFNLDDLGALFRAATAVSGSSSGQSLQIVDYSAGLISMSVSTVPESRAVFFRPDGTLLPTLDFSSAWGLHQGYEDVVGARGTASQLGFGSQLGVYLDTPATASGEHTRRQRTARTPVIVTPRASSDALPAFDPAKVDPRVVWKVLDELRAEDRFALDQPWSCVVDDRAGTGNPRLYWTVADRTFTTDLTGRVLH